MATKATLTSTISDVSSQISALRQHAEELRREIAAHKKRPLAREEVLAAARKEADERQAEAIEAVSFKFSKSRIDGKTSFFKPFDLEELRNFFVATGGLHRVIERMEKLEARPGEMTATEKAKRAAELQHQLDEAEREAEEARLQLEELGLSYPPDQEIQPEIFLEWSAVDQSFDKMKLRELTENHSKYCAIGTELVDSGSAIHRNIQNVHMNLNIMKANTVGDSEGVKACERKIAELTTEQQEQQRKIKANDIAREALGKVLNKCHQFLRDRGINIDK